MERKDKFLLGTVALIIVVFVCKNKIKSCFDLSGNTRVQHEQVKEPEKVVEDAFEKLEKSVNPEKVVGRFVEKIDKKVGTERAINAIAGILNKRVEQMMDEVAEGMEKIVKEAEKAEVSGAEIELKKEKVNKSQSTQTFGITVGKTTESELRRQYFVKNEEGWICDESYKLVQLNEEEFSSQDLIVEKVQVIVSSNGIVEALMLTIGGKVFSQLNPILAEKYVLSYKKEPFVGDAVAEYRHGDVNIQLSEPHLSFSSYLIYETKTISKLKRLYKERKEAQKKQNLRNSL